MAAHANSPLDVQKGGNTHMHFAVATQRLLRCTQQVAGCQKWWVRASGMCRALGYWAGAYDGLAFCFRAGFEDAERLWRSPVRGRVGLADCRVLRLPVPYALEAGFQLERIPSTRDSQKEIVGYTCLRTFGTWDAHGFTHRHPD